VLATVDVLVCDSPTGNAIVKMLAAHATGGRIEVVGSGYGPGVGDGAAMVGIISRATGAPVVANALVLLAKMARAGLPRIFTDEKARAERAGLAAVLARGCTEAAAEPGVRRAAAGPAKKTP
jgi:betaine reductase